MTDRPVESCRVGCRAATTGRRRLPTRHPRRPRARAVAVAPVRPAQRRRRARIAARAGPVRRAPRPRRGPGGDDVHLVPGARIAGGRYRLLVFHGGAPPLQFWQALDTALDRQVALTFVDPDGALPDEVLQEILSRTLRLSRIDKPGIARVLDVVHTGHGGLVVSRMGAGRFAAGGGRHRAVARRRRPGHAIAGRGGRRGPPGRRRVVDRPPEPGARQHRGRRRAGLPGDHARRQPAGRHPRHRCRAVRPAGQSVAAPESERAQRARPGRTRLRRASRWNRWSSTATFPSRSRPSRSRAVQEDGGIRSASTLLNLLQQATAVADRTEVLGPIDDSPAPATAPRVRASRRGRGRRAPAPQRADRRRCGPGVIVVALLVLASVVSKIFGNVGGGLNKDELG